MFGLCRSGNCTFSSSSTRKGPITLRIHLNWNTDTKASCLIVKTHVKKKKKSLGEDQTTKVQKVSQKSRKLNKRAALLVAGSSTRTVSVGVSGGVFIKISRHSRRP